MSHCNYFNDLIFVINKVKNSIITHTYSILMATTKLFTSSGTRRGFKLENISGYSRKNMGWQEIHLSLGRFFNTNLVCFSTTHFFFPARYCRNGREGSSRRLAINAKSSKFSRSVLSCAMPARTAFRSRLGRAFNAVKKISAVASEPDMKTSSLDW